MFGWLKKKMLREQLKMLYQNNTSISYLLGFYEENQSADIVNMLKEFETKNQSIAEATDGGKIPANHNDLEWLLQTNKELRKIYSTTNGAKIKSFDENHAPLLGWKEYYRNVIG